MKNYQYDFQRTFGNVLVFAIIVWKMPRWLYNILRNKALPVDYEQPTYPILFRIYYLAYLVKRGFSHLRFMDFFIIGGKASYVLWKLGIVSFWQRFILKRYHLPNNNPIALKPV